MPTLVYPQVIDDSPSPLHIEWQVEWEVVQCWITAGGEFNPQPRNIVAFKVPQMMSMQLEAKPGCFYRVAPAAEKEVDGQDGSCAATEAFYRKLLDMELVQAACEEMYHSNPKLYQEAA